MALSLRQLRLEPRLAPASRLRFKGLVGAGSDQHGGLAGVFLAQRDSLHRFLRARLGNDHDAEELLQELWIKLSTLRTGPLGDPIAYLFRMSENLAFDARRSAQRRQQRERDWSAARLDDPAAPDRDGSPSAEAAMLADERLRRVAALLDTLPDRTAEIFRAFRVEGQSRKAIATALGISVSAVEKHLQRAYHAIDTMQVQLGIEDAES